MSENQAIFRLDDIAFSYEEGKRPVLDGANLSLHPGQRIGLYGPNGCGKTTLFRCITGLAIPQRGTIFFHGKKMGGEKDFRELRCKVGFVLQHAEDQLFFPTVLEDVAFGPLNLGLSAADARQRAVETLEQLGLSGFEERLVHRLSGGEKKLISLAAVLAMRPEALLLDEPTNGLDNDSRARFTEILQHLPNARIAISHDWDFLTQVSDEYLTIMDGKLTRQAPVFAHSHVHVHPFGNTPHEH